MLHKTAASRSERRGRRSLQWADLFVLSVILLAAAKAEDEPEEDEVLAMAEEDMGM